MVDCVFDRIIEGQIPADIIYQDETVLAFRDIHPKAPVHVLIVPKKHIVSIIEIKPEEYPVICHMMEVANIVARKQGIQAYKLVINNGEDAGQAVMHLHMHLLGGKRLNLAV